MLIAAPFTPFAPDGALDTHRIPDLVAHLAASGVSGMFINGSTGEGPSLSEGERLAAAEAYIAAGRAHGVRSIVHAGHDALPAALRFARHAREHGADAVAALPTSYFKLASLHALVDYLAAIADAAGDLPLYYYHIPRLSGSDFDMLELLRRAERELPTLAGIKYSASDLGPFAECKAFAGGRYQMLFGCDEMMLAGFAMGADGAVGSTYNFLAPLYLKIIDDFRSGDLESARAGQTRAAEWIRIILTSAGMPGLKATMALAGRDCGAVRPPLQQPPPGILDELRSRLEAAGFFAALEAEGASG